MSCVSKETGELPVLGDHDGYGTILVVSCEQGLIDLSVCISIYSSSPFRNSIHLASMMRGWDWMNCRRDDTGEVGP